MYKMKRNLFSILMVSVCLVLVGGVLYAKSSPELIKQEEGYYYGYGTGTTAEEAMIAAKNDLVSNALTSTLRSVSAAANRIRVSDESVSARLDPIKPYSEAKKGFSPAVTYRIKLSDWDKKEKAYTDSLRSDLYQRFNSLSDKKSIADKIQESLAILKRIDDAGETDLLTYQPDGTDLFSRKVEAVCAQSAQSLLLTISTKDGFIDSSSQFIIKAVDSAGVPVSGLPLSAVWSRADLLSDDTAATVPDVDSTITTDSLGAVSIEYPASEDYKNCLVRLTVSTAFYKTIPSSVTLKKIDDSDSVDACYVHFVDSKSAFPSYTVPEGPFKAGAVPQDTRASKKEASHDAETGSYAIDINLVTNAQYAAFLHSTRAQEVPEYFDNSDYNQSNQPVVGVSEKDAESYAAWLSAQTGEVYRLPTQDEWEKAARAGNDSVYPWGDDSPAGTDKANYEGNGKYNTPSPVGTFENGNNAWGLTDMAGNVWEWTSSSSGSDTSSTLMIVKGGSWMDGPAELRISNFRTIDGLNGYPDVGFRLVKEVYK